MNDKRPQNGIDGFVLRRRSPQPGSGSGAGQRQGEEDMRVPARFLNDGNLPRPIVSDQDTPPASAERPIISPERGEQAHQSRVQSKSSGIHRSEIDASLQSIDEQPAGGKKRRKNAHPTRKRLIKRIALIILLLLLALGLFMGIKTIIASSRVFNGNIFDLLGAGQELKMDENGRSNILIFGTSEDDPGHEAGDLTDSIMVLSIDQKNKNAGMISVPRDLWVKYGDACSSGYEGKINALYECYAGSNEDQKAGADALREKVGEVFGMDIQYTAQVNYTVVRQVVDAVGGITVKIESDDPRGILDRNFDWKCRYRCYYVKHPNGPVTLDGDHALALARARGAAGTNTYGLGGSNFDREKYQQKIIVALKEKATSAGTLANPAAVTGLIDALGDNVRTNFTGGEVKTLITLANDIPAEKIKSISLIEPGNAVVMNSSIGGQSAVKPVAGTYTYSGIISFISGKLRALNGSESGEIAVLNGSSQMGVAGEKADELKEAGINVTSVGDTDANNYPAISWYDLTGGKQPKTSAKLKEALGVASSGSTLPSGVQSSADFVIIIGDGAN